MTSQATRSFLASSLIDGVWGHALNHPEAFGLIFGKLEDGAYYIHQHTTFPSVRTAILRGGSKSTLLNLCRKQGFSAPEDSELIGWYAIGKEPQLKEVEILAKFETICPQPCLVLVSPHEGKIGIFGRSTSPLPKEISSLAASPTSFFIHLPSETQSPTSNSSAASSSSSSSSSSSTPGRPRGGWGGAFFPPPAYGTTSPSNTSPPPFGAPPAFFGAKGYHPMHFPSPFSYGPWGFYGGPGGMPGPYGVPPGYAYGPEMYEGGAAASSAQQPPSANRSLSAPNRGLSPQVGRKPAGAARASQTKGQAAAPPQRATARAPTPSAVSIRKTNKNHGLAPRTQAKQRSQPSSAAVAGAPVVTRSGRKVTRSVRMEEDFLMEEEEAYFEGEGAEAEEDIDGEDQTLEETQRARDKAKQSELPPDNAPWTTEALRKYQVPGVRWDPKHGAWVTQWHEDGKQRSRRFSAGVFGLAGALKAARECRVEMIQQDGVRVRSRAAMQPLLKDKSHLCSLRSTGGRRSIRDQPRGVLLGGRFPSSSASASAVPQGPSRGPRASTGGSRRRIVNPSEIKKSLRGGSAAAAAAVRASAGKGMKTEEEDEEMREAGTGEADLTAGAASVSAPHPPRFSIPLGSEEEAEKGPLQVDETEKSYESPIRGVRWSAQSASWVASWQIEKGQQKEIYFSSAAYGFDSARQLAIEKRKEHEKDGTAKPPRKPARPMANPFAEGEDDEDEGENLMEEVPLRSPSRQQPKPFNKDPDPDEDQNAAPMAGQEDLLLEEGEEEEGGTEGPPPAKPSRLTDVYADRARALDMSEPSVSRRSNEEEGDDTGRQSAGNSDGSTQLCLSFSSEDQKPECRGEGEKGEEGCGGKGNEGEETRDSATKTEETIAERGAGIFPFRLPVKGEGKGEGSGKDTNAAAGMQMKAGEAKQ